MKRFVVVPIDDLFRMIGDYAGAALGLPTDCAPVKLMYKPTEQGKLGLMIESASWDGDQPAEEIRFDLRRVYGL